MRVFDFSVFHFDSLSRLLLYSVNQDNQQLRIMENFLFIISTTCYPKLHSKSESDFEFLLGIMPIDIQHNFKNEVN